MQLFTYFEPKYSPYGEDYLLLDYGIFLVWNCQSTPTIDFCAFM